MVIAPASMPTCVLCGADSEPVASFEAPPPGEPDYRFATYHRELRRCRACGHFMNVHQMDLSMLYQGRYREVAYGGVAIRQRFDKVMALPLERSDNRQRTMRIDAWVRAHGIRGRKLLDIGSGLSVFPAAMRAAGWDCTAVDPDPLNIRHARENVGVEGILGDFMNVSIVGGFDLVTLNKVLEHVPDMVSMLIKAAGLVAPDGVIYVELPDGEAALRESAEREEFFVDHLCAFSFASFSLLFMRAGLSLALAERIREPSGKYTLYGFARPA